MLRSLVITRTVHTSALLGLLLAACGGDGSSPTEPTTTSTGTTVAPSPSVTPTTSVQPTTTTPGPVVTPPVTPTGPTGDTGGPTGDTSGPTGDTAGPTGDTSGPTGDSGASSGPTGTTTSPTTSTGPSGGSSAPPDDTGTPPDPTGDPNPSGLMEPGAGGVARPSGTAGNLVVLPWAGYAGAITYSFDDADPTQVSHKADFFAMEVPFTWYLTSKFGSFNDPMYKEAITLGHEIGNHTSNHGGQGTQEVETFQALLQKDFQVVAYTMAAPNGSTGDYNEVAGRLFLLDRGAGNDGVIKADDNPNMLALNNYIPPSGAGTSELNPKVDGAISQKGWQTVCIHGFTGCNGCWQPIDWNGFKDHITYAKGKDIWIGTMENIAAYFIGRKLVKAAAPQAQGSDQVYTWTLPDVFPPGKYVRVKVDGGTLSQDGTPLPWNEHGFYEVALDAGELKLTP
jgi:hypothetical protein